jgi:hypothetical protein
MATPSAIPTDANRDNIMRMCRVTREKRQLWYQLTVLQQPERARACGAGTKANSDRRPVDPPPVVELRIKEGNSFDEGKEITFDYNASFFLYASLEQNRKIAPGRMQGQPNPPILTGVPASGMAYLDRPTAAGYFIFPDLSVRHEGQYRLSFSLFETTKEEKDFDLEETDSNMPPGVDWRMEIKTAPFDVFSAKKFPGLMESTPLSKEVADQGCRVRIRRDVRMRKREGKGSGHDRREDEYTRRRNAATPASEDPHAAAAAARARSISNSSEQRAPYPADRRPSRVDAYPPPPPPPPSYEPASRGHLSFGDHSAPQYAAPRQYAHQSLAPVSPGGPYTPATQRTHAEPQPYAYPASRAMPQQPYPSPVPRQENHERRQSAGAHVPSSPSVYASVEGHARVSSQHSFPPTPTSAQPFAHGPPPPPAFGTGIKLPPLRIGSLLSDSPAPPIEARDGPEPPPQIIPTGGKRKHDLTFTENTQSLRNHQRPKEYTGYALRECSPDAGGGYFKRADGSLQWATFNDFFGAA